MAGSFDCTFTDDPRNPTVFVFLADSDNALSNAGIIQVTVAEVAPTIVLTAGPNSADEGVKAKGLKDPLLAWQGRSGGSYNYCYVYRAAQAEPYGQMGPFPVPKKGGLNSDLP